LRDIAEDLDRGRQYIPQEDLRRFGVLLEDRHCSPEFVAMMQFQISRCHDLYRSADTGLAMLPDVSRRSIMSARVLYSRILDKIEAAQYDVFAQRVRVPLREKLGLVARLTIPMVFRR
jgi:15-cis-phytoene synthase